MQSASVYDQNWQIYLLLEKLRVLNFEVLLYYSYTNNPYRMATAN